MLPASVKERGVGSRTKRALRKTKEFIVHAGGAPETVLDDYFASDFLPLRYAANPHAQRVLWY